MREKTHSSASRAVRKTGRRHPLAAVALIVIGLAEEWGLTSHLFGFRAERIASESRASLLLVRKHLPFAELQPRPVSRPTAAESPATGQENAVEC